MIRRHAVQRKLWKKTHTCSQYVVRFESVGRGEGGAGGGGGFGCCAGGGVCFAVVPVGLVFAVAAGAFCLLWRATTFTQLLACLGLFWTAQQKKATTELSPT